MLLITGEAAELKKTLQKSSKEHKKTVEEHLVLRLLKNYNAERIRTLQKYIYNVNWLHMRLDPSGKTWVTVPLMHFLLEKKKTSNPWKLHTVKAALKVAYTWLDWPDKVKMKKKWKKLKTARFPLQLQSLITSFYLRLLLFQKRSAWFFAHCFCPTSWLPEKYSQ